jgi:hypothetical protein
MEYIGFDVLPPVVMRNSNFWDKTPFSLLKVNRRLKEYDAFIFRVEE